MKAFISDIQFISGILPIYDNKHDNRYLIMLKSGHSLAVVLGVTQLTELKDKLKALHCNFNYIEFDVIPELESKSSKIDSRIEKV